MVARGLDAVESPRGAVGCRRGDRVLTTPVSAFATTLAIVKLGAIPVFIDTDAEGLIDLERCAMESLISIKRAGADMILTYFAKDLARWLDK